MKVEVIGRPKKQKSRKQGLDGWVRQRFKQYDSGYGPPVEVAEATRETPLWEPTIRAMVAVPAARAAVMGLVLGIGAGFLIFLVAQDWGWDPKWGLAAGIAVWILATLVLVGGSDRQISVRERIVSTEDEDKWEPRTERLTMDLRTGEYTQQFMEIEGVSCVKLQTFAQAINNGEAVTVHSWTGKDGFFTRPEFDRLMRRFETLGWIVNYGPAGRKLTSDGGVGFRKLARGDFSVIIE